MIESSLARRYTRALVQTCRSEADFQETGTQLRAFFQLLQSDPMIKMGMETFLFSTAKKEEALVLISREMKLSEKLKRFLEILVSENRLPLLKLIIGQLDEVWFEIRGIERITVYSVVPLKADQQKRLQHKMEQLLEKEIIMRNEIDSDLLGGIKIQRGSVYYDFSLHGNLQRLRKQIIEES